MICKTFEVRDVATFIPVMAVKLRPACEEDRYLLARAGFGRTEEDQAGYIMVWPLAGGTSKATSDYHEWSERGNRTMSVIHHYLDTHFDDLSSGAVLDVEFIIGESNAPKQSESLDRF